MRGKQQSTDLQQLDEGLTSLDMESDALPQEVETELAPKTLQDLLRLDSLGERLDDAVKLRRGWIWIMIRKKVGHGNFKKCVAEQRKKYNQIWDCMVYARGVQRFPWIKGKITGRAIRHILSLPESEIYGIEEAITGIPEAQARKITHEAIEAEYVKIQQEKQSGKPRKEYPIVHVEDTKLDQLVRGAASAMEMLAYHQIPPPQYEKAKRYAREMTRHWDHMIYNLADPAHERVPLWEDSRATAADVESVEDEEASGDAAL